MHLSVSQRKFEAGMELELGTRWAQGEDLIAKNPSVGKTKREGNLLEKSIHIFPNSELISNKMDGKKTHRFNALSFGVNYQLFIFDC